MNNLSRRKRKFVALHLLTIFLLETLLPTTLLGLTGGPASPETSAFTPVGNSELVDLSTGDFKYDIPLLTVPGPNGGYPITLGYKSGRQMEEEASWVGWGFDLNVGAITRSLRGLPDDFRGDEVVQKMNYRENVTISANLRKKVEVFGKDFDSGSTDLTVHYNNITGWGGGIGAKFKMGGFGLKTAFDTKDGISLAPSYDFGKLLEEYKHPIELSTGFSTSGGLKYINLGASYRGKEKKLGLKGSAGISFSKPAPIGEIAMEQRLVSTELGFGLGKYYYTPVPYTIDRPFVPVPITITLPPLGYKEKFGGKVNTSVISIPKNRRTKTVNGYGYLYAEATADGELMDFHKENTLISYKYSPTLYVPIFDNDIFNVAGHGVTGSFRAYRNDIPMLKPQAATTTKISSGLTASYGTSIYIDGDLSWGGGKSQTGSWGVNGQLDGRIDRLSKIRSKNSNTAHPLYTPCYFDFVGGQVKSNAVNFENIGQDKAIQFPLEKTDREMIRGMKSKYAAVKAPSRRLGEIKADRNQPRDIQTNHIAYRTKGEILAESNLSKYQHIATGNTFPLQTNPINYNVHGRAHHINEISVTNTAGMRYVYGLPVYNLEKEDVVFSVNSQDDDDPLVDILNTIDLSLDNEQGREHYYKSIYHEDYVSAYLLTATYSDDYVDLTDNGPSLDDFGYWCKFNYKEYNDLQWRAPFFSANYEKGNYTDYEDDKASFTYGKREQKYLHSIETKSHLAVFYTSPRKDNHGVSSREQTEDSALGSKTLRLDSIQLYSRSDLTIPIKTVHFEFDYSLCKKVPNNIDDREGKLTLKKLYFTYQGNTKGELTPYVFNYGYNPDYEYLKKADRWGNYQDNPYGKNKVFPYTHQYEDQSKRDQNASAWNLTEIVLPSGGNIAIDYESDDYAYVHDVIAGQMFELVGFSASKDDAPTDELDAIDRTPNPTLFFKKADGISSGLPLTEDEVKRCLDSLKYIYFNANVRLKGDKSEYIKGYLKLRPFGDHGTVIHNGDTLGYLTVRNEYYGKGGQERTINGIRKAALQHYSGRADLQPKVFNPFGQITKLFGGPVKYYKEKRDYARLLSEVKPSFIRLNNPTRRKYGGGERVKMIKISTGWGETYGQKYSYVNEDGSSSGVADYEPFIGGEENNMRQPVNYNDILDYKSYQGMSRFFVEKPYVEILYPAPVVHYGSVVTENIEPQDADASNTFSVSNLGGITVHKFYTTKDFPVISRHSAKHGINHFKRALPVPFLIDRPSQQSEGHSQGFVTELNDMSGKLKSVSTYHYADRGNLTDANAKTRVEYIYHTDPDDEKKLNNEVTIINDDGVFEDGTIGRKEDFYVHQQEDFDYDKSRTFAMNYGTLPPPTGFYIVPFVQQTRSIEQRRTLVTNKIIYRTGILKEVRTNDNGRKTISKNLAYDAYTGEALIQTQENDFDKDVFSYNYAGHWKYRPLSGKYQNYRARFKVIPFQVGNYYKIDATGVNVAEILTLGDKLAAEDGTTAYVTSIDYTNNSFQLTKSGNTVPALDYQAGDILTVIESGYRNQQSVKVGGLVSLQDPMTFNYANYSTFLKEAYLNLTIHPLQSPYQFVTDCETYDYLFDDPDTFTDFLDENLLTRTVQIVGGNEECELAILLRIQEGVDSSQIFDPINSRVTFLPNSLVKIDESAYSFSYQYENGEIATGVISTDCDFSCPVAGILHASATELSENWTYDYADVGNPLAQNGQPLENIGFNPYHYGQKNVWRPLRSWVYQVDRLQSGTLGQNTEIDKDGTYELFHFFKWNKDTIANQNLGWTWTNEMTTYSPYGYDLENRNAIDIYSAEMYDSDQSVVTAVGANTAYQELSFDGFETDNTPGILMTHEMIGHFTATSQVIVTKDGSAHSGERSMMLPSPALALPIPVISTNLKGRFQPNNAYVLSYWLYVRDNKGSTVDIQQNGNSIIQSGTTSPVIDGWQKQEIVFTPGSNAKVDIVFTGPTTGEYALVDDMRVHPFNAAMKTYVYDTKTLRLTAELDNQNFATFYNYDEEGKLIQVKKETERGIVTVQSSRDNIAN